MPSIPGGRWITFSSMRAQFLDAVANLDEVFEPLRMGEAPDPEPGPGQVSIRVSVCGVCHTELDEIEGRAPPPRFPVIPGHQVVGRVVETGADAGDWKRGDHVGVAWIFHACGNCEYCLSERENLCPSFTATGRDVHGGYAEFLTAPAAFAHRIPQGLSDVEAAPLLCGGAIGYRSLRLCELENGGVLGLSGFGGSGHQVLRLCKALYPDTPVFVYVRDRQAQNFARELGADWAGNYDEEPPAFMQAVIDTTPAWKPILSLLPRLAPGGRMVINAIRKPNRDVDAWLQLDYGRDLWMERVIKSVANVTRSDVREYLEIAAKHRLVPEFSEYPLEEANRALVELNRGGGRGAKVLRIGVSP